MEYCSKEVISDQKSIHPDLEKLVKKFQKAKYLKPLPQDVIIQREKILLWIEEMGNPGIILDMGCGTGESTYNIAISNPNFLVVGIDKSKDRILRNNNFKKSLPKNMLLLVGNIVDWWMAFWDIKEKVKIVKQFILYPNPYPKQKHLKLRWQGQPIFRYIVELNSQLEVRSNWKCYLEEFHFALTLYKQALDEEVKVLKSDHFISPFEKKYSLSGQKCYSLKTSLI